MAAAAATAAAAAAAADDDDEICPVSIISIVGSSLCRWANQDLGNRSAALKFAEDGADVLLRKM